ncbi:UNVERIFIED_CONTAM: hypothetical protein GTU68_001180 [Idotea baltica]|nr:hypothetical protein [Idotea baltica]
MAAIVSTKYGSPEVLQLTEMEKPTPKEGELLIKVHAATVTAADGMMRKGIPYYGRLFLGLTKPKNPTPGTGFAGVIESIGKEVKQFKAGDRVFGEVVFGAGTNAEYTIVPEEGVLAIMPDNMSWSEAAPVCDGALTSLNFLQELANIQRGQKVLINGASGSLGTSAVQLAKHFGAEVTGVCSTENVELVASLGADEVIDYTKVDFTKNDCTYDIIYDTVGKSSFARCKGSLTEKGFFVSPVLSLALLLQMIWTSRLGSKKAKFSATGILPVVKLRSLLLELKGLFEKGKLSTVIDRCYQLEEVPDAHRYVDKGHKKGNVVVTLD